MCEGCLRLQLQSKDKSLPSTKTPGKEPNALPSFLNQNQSLET